MSDLNMIRKHNSRGLFILIIALLLSACSSGYNVSDDLSRASGKKYAGVNSSGDGQYYGGKPLPGKYVRSIPGFKCNAAGIAGEIEVTDVDARGTYFNPESCAVSMEQLRFDDLDYANYYDGRVGRIAGMFVLQSNEEVWCRNASSTRSVGYDVVIKANAITGRRQAHIVSSRALANGSFERTVFQPINTDRDIEMRQIVKYEGGAFELEIETQTYDATTGTMTAKFEYESPELDTERTLKCRLGEDLDVASPNRPFDIAQIFNSKAVYAFMSNFMSASRALIGI